MRIVSYAVFFETDSEVLRLPTNPEEIEIEEGQDIEEFDILKLGKIAVPSSMQLTTYSFEVELPHALTNYTLTSNGFKQPSYYIDLFRRVRNEKKPIRVIISNGIQDISELILIENLGIVEKAGEEGDYYISLSLKQYKPYGLKEVSVGTTNQTVAQTTNSPRAANAPKPQNNTHVVQSGDTLWKIAKKYLGDGNRCKEIHKLNQSIIGSNPNIIKQGQKLTIPKG